MEKFDTHKFLFTLNHEGRIKGHKIIFVDRNNNELEVIADRIEIGASPISCKIYDKDGKKHIIAFIRIKKIFLDDKLVWDNTDTDLSNTKIIKGY